MSTRRLLRGKGQDKGQSKGFTLIEILIALALFAIISVLAYRATSALTEGERRLAEEAARWRVLEQVFTRLEGDVLQALPRPMMAGKQTLPPWQASRQEGRSLLQFARAATALPSAVGTPQGQRVAYEWQKTEASGTLTLLYWPALDTAPGVEPQRYPLLDGVTFFQLSYLTRQGDWVSDWPRLGEAALPRALRVQLAGPDGAVLERLFVLQ